MFFVCAAVGKVTTGFMQNLFHFKKFGFQNLTSTFLIFSICGLLLIIGKFKVLDQFIKIIGIILLLSTIIAFILCLYNGPISQEFTFIEYFHLKKEGLLF